MASIRIKLIDKIKKDCGLVIPYNTRIIRKTLTDAQKGVGTLKWYFFMIGTTYYIGSQENMSTLLSADKIMCDYGDHTKSIYELSSS